MKRKIQIGVSVLFCLLLGLGAGTASLWEPMTWTIEQRSYQEVSLPEQVTAQVSLYPGCEDYSAVTALQPEMVQEINQQLGDLLPRRATLEDVQAGEYYRIYLTRQDLYRLRTTRQLVAALEQGDVESRPVWKPMHLQPVFAGCDYIDHGAVAEALFNRGVCLPSDTKMTEADLERVCGMIRGLWE